MLKQKEMKKITSNYQNVILFLCMYNFKLVIHIFEIFLKCSNTNLNQIPETPELMKHNMFIKKGLNNLLKSQPV